MKAKKTTTKEPPTEFLELLRTIAERVAIRRICREVGFELKPDTKDDRRKIRAEYAELREWMPKSQHHKIKKLIKKCADQIR